MDRGVARAVERDYSFDIRQPVSVAHPRSLAGAFGDNLEVIVFPLMYATALEVQPAELDERSLDQSPVRWEWNVRPRHRGDQAVSLGIDAQWRSGDVTVADRQIWRAQLPIYLEQSLLTTGGHIGVIRVVSWAAAALGTRLVIPLLSRLVVDRRAG